VVKPVSILERLARLARHEREARGRIDLGKVRAASDDDANVRKVPLSDEVAETVPAGVDAFEWAGWGEEARYVLLERLGVGAELGMAEKAALPRAVVEARMAHAGVPLASTKLVGRALELFKDFRIVSVELRSKP